MVEPKKESNPLATFKKAASTVVAAQRMAKEADVKWQHPPYQNMVVRAISSLKERTGSSVHAIKKWIFTNFSPPDGTNIARPVNAAIKKLVDTGALAKIKGSYKVAKTESQKKGTGKLKSAAKKVIAKNKDAKKKSPKKLKAAAKKVIAKNKEAKKVKAPAKKSSKAKTATKKSSTDKAAKDLKPKKTVTKKATKAKASTKSTTKKSK